MVGLRFLVIIAHSIIVIVPASSSTCYPESAGTCVPGQELPASGTNVFDCFQGGGKYFLPAGGTASDHCIDVTSSVGTCYTEKSDCTGASESKSISACYYDPNQASYKDSSTGACFILGTGTCGSASCGGDPAHLTKSDKQHLFYHGGQCTIVPASSSACYPESSGTCVPGKELPASGTNVFDCFQGGGKYFLPAGGSASDHCIDVTSSVGTCYTQKSDCTGANESKSISACYYDPNQASYEDSSTGACFILGTGTCGSASCGDPAHLTNSVKHVNYHGQCVEGVSDMSNTQTCLDHGDTEL